MLYRKVLCLLTLLVFSQTEILHAQYSLSGIIGGDTKETQLLEGVEIYIPELNRLDISKEGGTYIFNGIGAGVIHVQYAKLGFKTVLKTILIKDSATVVHVNLIGAVDDDREVLYTSGYNGMASFVPYSVETVSSKEYNQLGGMNAAVDLSYNPGLDYISEGNAFSKPVIRGMSNNRIQLRQFGTRIENQTWYDRSTLGLNMNGAGSFEVVKGPSSILYGADALGGVIILNEEKPAVAGTVSGDFTGEFNSSSLGYNAEAGVKGQSSSGIFYGLRLGTLSHTSYVQGDGSDVRKNSEDLDFAINSKFNNQNAKIYAGLAKPWGTSRLTFSYMQQESGIIGIEDSVYNDPFRYNEIQRERKFSLPYLGMKSTVISSENTILTGHSKLGINLAYQSNQHEEFLASGNENPDAISLDLSTISYDIKYSSDPLKKFGYTIGSQGFFQNNDNVHFEKTIPDAKISSFGAFGLLRYDVKRWNFLAGVRIDIRNTELSSKVAPIDQFDLRKGASKQDFLPANATAGLVYHASEVVYIKLNGATGYSAPNYLQLFNYGLSSDTSRFEYGNDSLNLEKSSGVDLSMHANGKSLTLGASVFYNFLNDYTYLANTGATRDVSTVSGDTLLPVYYYSQSDASISGTEVYASIHPVAAQWFRFDMSYAMQRGSFKKDGDLPAMPGDKAVFSLQFQSDKMNYLHSSYIRIILRKYFDQSLVSEFESEAPGYSLVDFHIGGKIKIARQFLDISVAANNLMNESYTNQLSLLPAGIHEMGRNVCIRLSMPFGIMKVK